jgi:hypothetical protein
VRTTKADPGRLVVTAAESDPTDRIRWVPLSDWLVGVSIVELPEV